MWGAGFAARLAGMKLNGPQAKEKDQMKSKFGIAVVSAALASMCFAATAGAADVTLDKESLAFGNQNVNTASATQTVQLGVPCLYVLDLGQYGGKSCSAPGRIEAIEASGDFTQANDCPLPIYNNAVDGSVVTCTVAVAFEPTATGPLSGALNFKSYGKADAYTVALSGTGTTPPVTGPGEDTGNGTGGKPDAKGGGSVSGQGAAAGVTAKKCKKGKKGAAKAKKCRKAKRR
jgi:hypothetical protein